MKQHDSHYDSPLPLADLSNLLAPGSLPLQPLPETARTDELTTPAISGSLYRSTFRQQLVRDRVQKCCFAGPEPVLHVEHPPHMLEKVKDTEPEVEKEIVPEFGARRKRRLEVVVEIPIRRKRLRTPTNAEAVIIVVDDSPETADLTNVAEVSKDGVDLVPAAEEVASAVEPMTATNDEAMDVEDATLNSIAPGNGEPLDSTEVKGDEPVIISDGNTQDAAGATGDTGEVMQLLEG
jgi:hypothetical protein